MNLPNYLPALAIWLLFLYIPSFLGLVYLFYGRVDEHTKYWILYAHGAIIGIIELLIVFKHRPRVDYWFLWGLLATVDGMFVFLVFALSNYSETPNRH